MEEQTIKEFFANESQETISWLQNWHDTITAGKPFAGWSLLDKKLFCKYYELASQYSLYLADIVKEESNLLIYKGNHVSDN